MSILSIESDGSETVLGVDHDAGWPLAPPGLVQGVSDLVEPDDRTHARQRVEPALADGVERAVPVLGVRTATELDGDALVGGDGAVERAPRVPAAGAEDAGPHLARLDDLLDQSGPAHALEHHRRLGAPARDPL